MTNVLLLAYGNELRGDDAVAHAVAHQWNPGRDTIVHAITARQLLPEHAAALAKATTVVFADATVVGPDEPLLTQLTDDPNEHCSAGHFMTPVSLLKLARAVFGVSPSAWLLSLPAYALEVGDGLSPRCRSNIPRAIELLDQVLTTCTK